MIILIKRGFMNTTVKLKEETLKELKSFGAMGDSWDDAVQKLLKKVKESTSETKSTNETKSTVETKSTEFKTAKVDSYGKASISRTLAGKNIEWRVKQ
jgi:glycosylphosphatidylinositol transamidase (GPIT) subunit GPI8